VLGEGLAGITTGAAAYHKQILDTGARFEAASRLADLQRVRAAITSEVKTLRAAVEERQVADTKVTAALRAEGVRTDVDLMRRNVGKNFKYADAARARFVVVVGDKEAAEGAVTVRDLSTGEQRVVPIYELPSVFKA